MASISIERIREFLEIYSQGNTFECQFYKYLKVKSFESTHTLGKMQFEILVAEEWSNGFGTLFGGVYAWIIDACSNIFLLATTNKSSVNLDTSISYFRSANPGEVLLVDIKCAKAGSRINFLHITISCKGKPIAFGTHTTENIREIKAKL